MPTEHAVQARPGTKAVVLVHQVIVKAGTPTSGYSPLVIADNNEKRCSYYLSRQGNDYLLGRPAPGMLILKATKLKDSCGDRQWDVVVPKDEKEEREESKSR